jgi:hypothetical protein
VITYQAELNNGKDMAPSGAGTERKGGQEHKLAILGNLGACKVIMRSRQFCVSRSSRESGVLKNSGDFGRQDTGFHREFRYLLRVAATRSSTLALI